MLSRSTLCSILYLLAIGITELSAQLTNQTLTPQTSAFRDGDGNILKGQIVTTSLSASGTVYVWTAYQDGGVWSQYRSRILTGTVAGTKTGPDGHVDNYDLLVRTGPLGWGISDFPIVNCAWSFWVSTRDNSDI